MSYAHLCLTYIAKVRPFNAGEVWLATHILSHYAVRLVMILYVTLYTLISMSRALLFLAPATAASAGVFTQGLLIGVLLLETLDLLALQKKTLIHLKMVIYIIFNLEF